MWKPTVRIAALAGIGVCALPLLMSASRETRISAERPAEVLREDKEAKVRELLELTGAAAMGKQMMEQMMEQFDSMPGLPEGFAARFLELADPDEMIELIVPIYVKALDEPTIDGAIVYFKSDVGRAWIAAQPRILRESTAAGQKWGQELAERALR